MGDGEKGIHKYVSLAYTKNGITVVCCVHCWSSPEHIMLQILAPNPDMMVFILYHIFCEWSPLQVYM